MSFVKKSLALRYVVQEPEQITSETPAIILLHGIGGNEYQLFNFAHGLPGDHLIVAARAPFTVHNGSYTWFSVDFSVPSIRHDEAEESRRLLKEFVTELCHLYGIQQKNVCVLGFSQGAIMGMSVGLTEPGLFGRLVALSGRMLPETAEMSAKLADQLKDFKIFIGHGLYDPTLPVRWAREARNHLQALPVSLTYREYPIWHEVSEQELSDILGFIRF